MEKSELLQNETGEAFLSFAEEAPPEEIGKLFNELQKDFIQEDEKLKILFSAIPFPKNARTFEHLDFNLQNKILEIAPLNLTSSLLNELSPDDRTKLFSEMPKESLAKWLSMLSVQERKDALKLLEYPPESIGRLMTTDYIAVRPEWTCEKTIKFIRDFGLNSETINFIYVVDKDNKLIDDLKIREILLAKPEATIGDLVDNRFVSLEATSDQEKTITTFMETDRFALPVTDFNGKLLGIVTADDVLDVIEREDTEDIQKLGGSEALDEPYLEINLTNLVKKRAGWLIILFIGEMLTASAMSFFENEIASAVVLALFIPLIISSGGNSGSQAATIITRALALGEVSKGDWLKVFRREIISGVMLGLILGIIGFLRVIIWSTLFDAYGAYSLKIAATVGFSLIGVVLWGTLSGSMLPIFLKSLGFDPAVSSAPFVATIVDVTGIIIYFSMAFLFLKGTLL
ncbi:MAG: magnesium transporter [Sporocytophaga sp.]|uniref:magnesium transporter n=1 Tax=Sporocytophaga sp. TaxID=2231183 RepID=UPI001B21E8B4|nr:magnesium transporter [Sporocytophaga sp.]MBO9699492.1 magnesium transporter [Sporocytophaga sp.]